MQINSDRGEGKLVCCEFVLGKDCELLGTTFTDDIFTVVPDACFKIERTWKIINWCTYNPNQIPLCINVPNPNPNPISNAAANLPGPIVSACGTLAPWAPTVVKINPTDPVATNYCTFWDANAKPKAAEDAGSEATSLLLATHRLSGTTT